MAQALVPLMPTISKLCSANSAPDESAMRAAALQRERDAPLLNGSIGI
jgi:hypothetical protein